MTFNRPRLARSTRAATAALATVLSGTGLLLPGAAQAGTFSVSQCNTVGLSPAASLGFDGPRYFFDGVIAGGCSGDGAGMTLDTGGHRLPAGGHARFWLNLPAEMAATTITHADLSFTAPAQSASVAEAYLAVYGPARLMEANMQAGLNQSRASFSVPSARGLQFDVWCSDGGGPGHCTWPGPVWTMRGLTLTLSESAEPSGSLAGGLLNPGAQKGVRPVELSLADADSGVRQIELKLGSTVVHSSTAACRADRFAPCPSTLSKTVDVDTTLVADGSHGLRLVVTDLAGNSRSVDAGDVVVDNVPPPVNTGPPAVHGEKRLNRTLSGSDGTWSGGGLTFAHRWERYEQAGWEPIPGATESHRTLVAADVGKRVRLKVTASNAEGSTVAYSEATEPVTAPGRTDADGDFDGDGVPNQIDPDDDGDGVLDVDDVAPFDPGVGSPPRADRSGVGGFDTPNGSGASPSAALAMVFEGTRSRTMRVRYGRARRVTGTLLDSSGRPITGATLDVASQVLSMGAARRPAGTVTTDSRGRFAYRIPAGPSRRITVSYRWFRESARHTHTTSVRVDVVPRVTLAAGPRALSNGERVRFTGRVAGAPRGVRKVVELQARVGSGWRTFAAPRLSRSGTFTHSYRFTRTMRPTTYQFRAVVKAESGWPFLSGQTRTARVAVRP